MKQVLSLADSSLVYRLIIIIELILMPLVEFPFLAVPCKYIRRIQKQS